MGPIKIKHVWIGLRGSNAKTPLEQFMFGSLPRKRIVWALWILSNCWLKQWPAGLQFQILLMDFLHLKIISYKCEFWILLHSCFLHGASDSLALEEPHKLTFDEFFGSITWCDWTWIHDVVPQIAAIFGWFPLPPLGTVAFGCGGACKDTKQNRGPSILELSLHIPPTRDPGVKPHHVYVYCYI